MFDYATLQATASRLITNFGATAVITRSGGSTFDPVTGSYSGGSTVTINAKAVRAQFTQSEKASQAVQESDIKLLVEAGKGAPLIDDNVFFDSVDYRVLGVMEISPSGVDVYYELHLRS